MIFPVARLVGVCIALHQLGARRCSSRARPPGWGRSGERSPGRLSQRGPDAGPARRLKQVTFAAPEDSARMSHLPRSRPFPFKSATSPVEATGSSLISGPCVIEEESVCCAPPRSSGGERAAGKVPVIFKAVSPKGQPQQRRLPHGARPGGGLKVLARMKRDFGFPILTDIHYPSQANRPQKCATCSRSPHLCMQTTLVLEAARTGGCHQPRSTASSSHRTT
jgi:hypothetical protein